MPLRGARPPFTGEIGWSIGDIVGHIGSSRLYFASAYRGEGWIGVSPEMDRDDAGAWIPWLQLSADRFRNLLHLNTAANIRGKSQSDHGIRM